MYRFDPKRGLVAVSIDEHVRHCIQQLLLTRVGERALSPELGTSLDRFLYRRMTPRWRDDLRVMILGAIAAQEPRVAVEEVWIERHPEAQSRIQLKISYRVLETQKFDYLRVTV